MSVKTFAALVTHGQLCFQESLADLDGQRVVVTLVPAADRDSVVPPADVTPPDWLDVEKDVAFRMPFHWETVQSHALDAGAVPPTVILPEELLDD